MTKIYTCDLCNKEFNQKIDYTRHKNKKNACISPEKLKNIIEEKINTKSTMEELTSVFRRCLDILRDNEYLTGDKALRNLSYFLVLRLIEPKIGKEIIFDAKELFANVEESGVNPHGYELDDMISIIEYAKFSTFAQRHEAEMMYVMDHLWFYVLSVHEKTKDIFEGAQNKIEFKRDNTYKKIVDTLAKFNFEAVPEDVQGHAYEQVIKDLMVGKVLGQFFTQPIVKDMMVELINPQLHPDGTIESIFDPAMGTGGFLKTCLFHIEKQAQIKGVKLDWENITRNLGGREVEPDTFTLAKSNMLICSGHMFSESVSNEDSIRKPIKEKYDVILTNPPFGIKGLKYDEITDPLRDEYLPIKGNSAVPLFIQAIIYMLKVGGRCAVVLPCGQELFGQGKPLVALREYLMKTCDLKEIIYLPSGVFTNTTIKTCVFYFHKKKECGDVIKASKAKNRTYTFTKTLVTKKVKFYNYDTESKSKNLIVEVEAQQIADNGYSLNHTDYMEKEEKNDSYDVVVKKLGEVFDIEKGSLQSSKNKDGQYTFITASDDYKTHNTFTHDCECLLYVGGAEGSLGKVHYFKGKFIASDLVYILRSKTEGINYKYVWYMLNHERPNIISNQLYARGTPKKAISISRCMDIPIPIPPLSVQEDLVKKLETLCENADRLSNDKIQNLKDSVKIYIETFANGQEKKLGEVCEINQGKCLGKGDFVEGKYKVIGGGKVIGYHNFTNRQGNDIVITRVGDVNVTFNNKPYYLTDNGFSLNTINDDIDIKYVYYYLTSSMDILKTLYNGTAQKVVPKSKLSEFTIPIPPPHIQQKIIDYCDHMNGVISALEKEPELNKELVQGLFDSVLRRASQPASRTSSTGSRVRHTDLGDGFVLEEDSDDE